MVRAELIFIPAPGIGHLVSAVEVAKLLVRRDERISISILLLKLPNFHAGVAAFTENLKKDAPDCIDFVDIPAVDESIMTDLMSLPHNSFLESFVSSQRAQVTDVVATILKRSEATKLGGFVLDMFCTPMIEVANEFNVPAYVFFTSGAAFLGFIFYAQFLKDSKGQDISEFKDSGVELSVPAFSIPVPDKVFPSVMLSEGGSSRMSIVARRLREVKAILINSVLELETHAFKSLADDKDIPLIYPVGPIINLERGEATPRNRESDEAIMSWLDSQPCSSVVFLCFGSMGSFSEDQVMEMACALELSGKRFLWSLRCPLKDNKKMELPKDYEDYVEVLPEGFLERTAGIGKVIGWAPQVKILSHRAVGGFVSHCGWNSTLESLWCGVPIAAWPVYSEQQTNAFQLVKELGLAVEIKLDYHKDIVTNEASVLVTAEEIERGIRCLMEEEGEVRKKVKMMKAICRKATAEGGSSYNSLGHFIEDVLDNIKQGE